MIGPQQAGIQPGRGIVMRISTITATAALVLAASTTANAADLDVVEAPEIADIGTFYVATRVGAAWLDDQGLNIFNGPGADFTLVADTKNASRSGSVALGTGFLAGMRAEVELSLDDIWSEEFVETNGGTVFEGNDARGRMALYTAHINAFYDYDFGAFKPYLGIGAGVTQARFDNFGVNAPAGGLVGFAPGTFVGADDTSTTFSYSIHAGLNFAITERTTLEIGYRALQLWNLEVETADGTERTWEAPTVHRVHVGFRIAF